ncbi:hypothetical protein LTR37_001428 [Vermiconidia calcicola]|uniref:Uncharacterized protein n=1 Tax=Vermiconidia calcicola TaxID=1690605 RepID=A0ACC3NVQ2_9PEZI|nr:hypothetical protein LTR37_001428 [Vermiconidia calcicola]
MSNYDCGTDSESELTPTRRYATVAAGKLNMKERTTVDVGMSPSQKMMWLKLSKAAYDAHIFPDCFFDYNLMLLPTIDSAKIVSNILYEITRKTFVKAMDRDPKVEWTNSKDDVSKWSICNLVLKFGDGTEQVVYRYWRSKHLHGTEEVVYRYWRGKSSTEFTLMKAKEPRGGLDGDIAVKCNTACHISPPNSDVLLTPSDKSLNNATPANVESLCLGSESDSDSAVLTPSTTSTTTPDITTKAEKLPPCSEQSPFDQITAALSQEDHDLDHREAVLKQEGRVIDKREAVLLLEAQVLDKRLAVLKLEAEVLEKREAVVELASPVQDKREAET